MNQRLITMHRLNMISITTFIWVLKTDINYRLRFDRSKMSSTIKDMLIRTGAPARLCSSRQRLFKGKYVVMNDLLIGENRSITRLRRGGGAYGVRTCQDRHSSGGFSNISKPPLQNKTRAQTISSSTPAVSDPAPTTTKVLLSPLYRHVSSLSTAPISLDDGCLVMVQD